MFQRFYPKQYVDSAYQIPYEKLYEQGYRGVLFDIDNTLVPHGARADERVLQLFKRLRAIGFSCCLISNNKEARVNMFQVVDVTESIYKAGKPKPASYVRAMKKMGTDTTNTIFVGDQLFTDIWGANRAGIYTYLVKPIHPKEEIQIVLKRYLEKVVLHSYKRALKSKGMNKDDTRN